MAEDKPGHELPPVVDRSNPIPKEHSKKTGIITKNPDLLKGIGDVLGRSATVSNAANILRKSIELKTDIEG